MISDIQTEIKEKALTSLSFWNYLSSGEKELILSHSVIREFGKNQIVNSLDSECMGIVILLQGGIRVYLLSDEGREITLYRLGVGECCITTASCAISQITFDTEVSTTEETRLLVIPLSVCSLLAETNIYFRCFMFETETERYSQAIWVVQQLLFKRFDQRLAEHLISVAEQTGDNDIRLTQEEIAQQINSAREVVARMLHHFSKEGLVELRRGHIILSDIEGLKKIIN